MRLSFYSTESHPANCALCIKNCALIKAITTGLS